MIEAIKQGDAFAFEQAFIQYRQKVYAYFIKKTASAEDAKDLLQITFLKLWKYRSTLNSDYLLDQHLFHIARTVYIDYLRSANKGGEIKSIMSSPEVEISYTNSELDIKNVLQSALSRMPELRKKIFVLNRLHGYSYREVAEMLSISVKAVDNNLTKALRQLRKAFMLLVTLFYFNL